MKYPLPTKMMSSVFQSLCSMYFLLFTFKFGQVHKVISYALRIKEFFLKA